MQHAMPGNTTDTMFFWGPMFVFLSPNGPNDALFYNAIYSKYIFRFYCVLSVLSWFWSPCEKYIFGNTKHTPE